MCKMTETEKRLYRCCFTGHRPEKLTVPQDEIKAALETKIREAIADGYQTFVSGMARGVDLWAAEIVLRIKEEGWPGHLLCASPYRGFEAQWSEKWKRMYRRVMDSADLAGFVCAQYSPGCFQIRNEWMVNHSNRVIAVYNGRPSGTRNTIRYAKLQGVSVVYIEG